MINIDGIQNDLIKLGRKHGLKMIVCMVSDDGKKFTTTASGSSPENTIEAFAIGKVAISAVFKTNLEAIKATIHHANEVEEDDEKWKRN